jgi:phosphoribosylformylglycinamidine synthase
MSKPRVLVLTGYGINCDYETEFGFNLAGALAERVHINSLIMGEKNLRDFQILAFPGGFSFGDDVASGKVLATKSKVKLGDEIHEFIERGGLIIGICNGFQVLAKFGILSDQPAEKYEQRITVTYNDSSRYEDRWVWLKRVSKKCVWLDGIDGMYLPVAHGEGKFFAEENVLNAIMSNDQVAFVYARQDLSPAQGEYPLNPNGSQMDIAGVCDPSGRILGMMPHPERFLSFYNHPRWTFLKEKLKRRGEPIPETGDGLKILQNGVKYFTA